MLEEKKTAVMASLMVIFIQIYDDMGEHIARPLPAALKESCVMKGPEAKHL